MKKKHITQTTLKEKIDYFRAQIRYWAFTREYFWLVPKHIQEQYNWRLYKMDAQCFEQGECKLCGCDTTKLQFANRACDKPCYPRMKNKKNWKQYKKENENILYEL